MPWLPGKDYEGKSKAGPYGDFVVHVDDTLGRIVKALDDGKLSENTLLICTSDNGGFWFPEDIQRWKHRSNAHLHGQKSDLWEGGHRVPFIARWPGRIPAGSTSDEVICLTDLLATAASLVGSALPDDAGEDSFDLTPVLLGKKLNRPVREGTIHQSGDGTLAIRQGPWRLANALGSHGFSKPQNIKPKAGEPQGELYNLADDPMEKTNLWLERPEVVKRLTELLEKYRAEGRSRPRQGTIGYDPSGTYQTQIVTWCPAPCRSLSDWLTRTSRPLTPASH
jgi:arylsulfatase A-like enzyme